MSVLSIEKATQYIEPMLPVIKIEAIHKGASRDKKYIVWGKNGKKYVIRLSGIKKSNIRRNEFTIICCLYLQGVKCPKPIAFGSTSDGKYSYLICDFIKGRSSNEVLPLPEKKQFEIGIAAGEELKKMHLVKCPHPVEDWFENRYNHFLLDLREFNDLKLSFYKEKYVLDYIWANINLMKNRPSCYQHNDYGVGNIVIKNKKFNGIIDFNGYKWGDPIHDFYKLPWSSKGCSVPFVSGEINGYCSGKITKAFWARYNLYVMMNLHRRLVMFYKKYPLSVFDACLKETETIIVEHDLKSNGPPVWYIDQN